MDKKLFDLALFLTKDKNIKFTTLSEEFNKSERAIRNDIVKLNEFLSKNNYDVVYIDNGVVNLDIPEITIQKIFNELNYYDYSLESTERLIIIILYALMIDGVFTISDLSQFMEVSVSTVKKDLNRVKSFINNYNFDLVSEASKGNILYRKNQKFLYTLVNDLIKYDINNIIRFFNQEITFNIKNIGYSKLNKYINELKNIINDVERETGQILTKMSQEVLLYFTAIYLTCVDKKGKEKKHLGKKNSNTFENLLIQSLAERFDINLLELECLNIKRLINSLNFQTKKYENNNILKIQFLTRKLIEDISREISINLQADDELLNNLSKHLSLVLKKEIKKIDEFEHVSEIALRYPDLIKSVNNSLDDIKGYAKRRLSEIEIHFIVVYLVAAIEKMKNKVDDISILIVCTEGLATSILIKEKIKRIVSGTNQFIANKYNYEDEIKRIKPDVIISNIKLDKKYDYLFIKNITLLEELEILNTQVDEIKLNRVKTNKTFFNNIKNERKKVMDKNNSLSKLLPYENIEINVSVENWEEGVKKAGNILLKKGYINENYINSMIKNIKEYGPYVVVSQGVAIPHAGYDDGVYRTGMSLIKLNKEIDFGDGSDSVKVTYIMCLSSINNEHFNAFFDLIYGLQNKKLKRKFMMSETVENIRSVIHEMEEIGK